MNLQARKMLHAPFVRSFEGFGQPWNHLGPLIEDVHIREVALGSGYIVTGLNLDSLVTPSTSWATSGPNRSSTSVRLYSVSSGTSCSRAAWIAMGSTPSSARICAEAIGCVTYGSPVARFWPRVRVDREVERLADRLEVAPGVLGEDRRRSAPCEAPRGQARGPRRCRGRSPVAGADPSLPWTWSSARLARGGRRRAPGGGLRAGRWSPWAARIARVSRIPGPAQGGLGLRRARPMARGRRGR